MQVAAYKELDRVQSLWRAKLKKFSRKLGILVITLAALFSTPSWGEEDKAVSIPLLQALSEFVSNWEDQKLDEPPTSGKYSLKVLVNSVLIPQGILSEKYLNSKPEVLNRIFAYYSPMEYPRLTITIPFSARGPIRYSFKKRGFGGTPLIDDLMQSGFVIDDVVEDLGVTTTRGKKKFHTIDLYSAFSMERLYRVFMRNKIRAGIESDFAQWLFNKKLPDPKNIPGFQWQFDFNTLSDDLIDFDFENSTQFDIEKDEIPERVQVRLKYRNLLFEYSFTVDAENQLHIETISQLSNDKGELVPYSFYPEKKLEDN